MKIRWNPKFGRRDLENDLLTSMTSEMAEWIFFKNCIFKISASSWGKWALAWLSIQTFKNTSFWPFVLRGHQEVAKNLKLKLQLKYVLWNVRIFYFTLNYPAILINILDLGLVFSVISSVVFVLVDSQLNSQFRCSNLKEESNNLFTTSGPQNSNSNCPNSLFWFF